MTFSVIIPTKDRLHDLQNCIRSITEQTVLPDEVIVVDSSSEDLFNESRKACEGIIDGKVKFLYLDSATGVNRQRNKGAGNAGGEIIFFFDDDVILNPDYCEKILEVYKSKSSQKIGGVRGTVSDYYETSWIAINFKKFFLMNRSSMNERSRFLPSLGYVFIVCPSEIIEVEAMPSLVCSFYKSVFDEFKFDESFERCTDLEISYRVSKKYKLFHTPYAIAVHHSTSETHFNVRKRNKIYLIYTHKLVKKHMPRKIRNWLAYYWSILGELNFSIVKSIIQFNPDPVMGTLEGISAIMMRHLFETNTDMK